MPEVLIENVDEEFDESYCCSDCNPAGPKVKLVTTTAKLDVEEGFSFEGLLPPDTGSLKSTATEILAAPTVLRGLPLGKTPSARFYAKDYATCAEKLSMNQNLAGWFYAQDWLVKHRDEIFSVKYAAVERLSDTYFFNMMEFLCDYFILACAAESRHGSRTTGITIYPNCPLCAEVFLKRSPTLPGAARATGAGIVWTLAKDRYDIFVFLLHVFLDHGWGAKKPNIGGPNWGYITKLAKDLNEGWFSGDLNKSVQALDAIIYAEHCSSGIWQSRFSWSGALFYGSITGILSAKNNGNSCCWATITNQIPAGIKKVIPTTPTLCDCERKYQQMPGDDGLFPQQRFVKSFRQRDRCPCGGNRLGVKETACGRWCKECNTCKGISATHNHVHAACGTRLDDPEVQPKPKECPGYCPTCKECFGPKWLHTRCHYCGRSTNVYSPALIKHRSCGAHAQICEALHEKAGYRTEDLNKFWRKTLICGGCRPEFNAKEPPEFPKLEEVQKQIELEAMETVNKLEVRAFRPERMKKEYCQWCEWGNSKPSVAVFKRWGIEFKWMCLEHFTMYYNEMNAPRMFKIRVIKPRVKKEKTTSVPI